MHDNNTVESYESFERDYVIVVENFKNVFRR
jgi:hypothetical protein